MSRFGDSEKVVVDRRRLLQGFAAGGLVSVAGCQGSDETDEGGDTGDETENEDGEEETENGDVEEETENAGSEDGTESEDETENDDEQTEIEAVQVRTHEDLGDILAGPDGNAVYALETDEQEGESSACQGECAQRWPPLTVDGKAVGGPNVSAEITTFEREDGQRQVAADGWPLYQWHEDSAEEAGGQGVDDSWWVLDPTGTPIRQSESENRLKFAISREGLSSYDPAESVIADDATVLNLVYDDLFEQNSSGEHFNWMAAEYELVEAQDVSPSDYVPYMREYEIRDTKASIYDEERLPFPILNIERPNVGLVGHPEDLAAFQAGELGRGDSFRALTREEAADAVADGVFGTRIEGRLHEGIEFHNGEELTAGNIVNSYDRYVGSPSQSEVFESFLAARAPDGEDGNSFELYAHTADATADAELPPPALFPSEHIDLPPGELEPRDGGPVPVGTGPYEIEEYNDRELLLTRTDNYWVEEVGVENLPYDVPEEFPDGPVIDEVLVRSRPVSIIRVTGLEVGNLDIAFDLPPADLDQFLEWDFTVATEPAPGATFLQIPVESGPLAERSVRQAVSALVPRQEIVDTVAGGWGVPARAPLPRPAASAGSTMSYEELESQEWAYSAEPDVEAAAEFLEEAGVETPISLTIETNRGARDRLDKIEIIVDALNRSGLFDATLETPGVFDRWFTEHLTQTDAHERYADQQRAAAFRLLGGSDPHQYAAGFHDPENHNDCCNFFFPAGTFDFIDLLRSCRFGVDATEDPDARRQRYDELWPELVGAGANLMIDYPLEAVVAHPDIEGYSGHPDRRRILSYGLYAPYDGQLTSIER